MTLKPADAAPMIERQLRTMADIIPGFPCRFHVRSFWRGSQVHEPPCPPAVIAKIESDRTTGTTFVISVKDREESSHG